MAIPKFSRAQQVCFIGGEGMIQNCHWNDGTWTYLIKMALGPEPICGRVGAETEVLLDEGDLRVQNSLRS